MLEIKNLSVNFTTRHTDFRALGPIDLTLSAGDTCSILGKSGCGKSTMLNVLGGIIKQHSGSVLLDGSPLNPKRQNIGFIPQNFGLLPWKTVEQNCLLSLRIKGIPIDEAVASRISYILHKLDIEDLMHRLPKELSGGQKQRVAIARAFILNPTLLLMDEPFSALDAITREEAQELFINIWNSYQTTTLLVTHSIEEALYMGKKIIIMSECPGTIVDIIDNPLFNSQSPRQNKEFLELSNFLRSIIKKG